MPTTAEQAKEAVQRKADIAHGFDLVAGTCDSLNGSFFHSLGTRLVQLAGLRPGDRVLDLGCGRGAVLLAAAEAVGGDGYAVGVDLSPAMVRATAAEIAARGLRNIAVRVDDAEDPGFHTGSFEAVLAGLVLFVTPDPAAVLTSAHRVLVPGGRFATTTLGPDDPAWQRPLAAALAVGRGSTGDDPSEQLPGANDRGGKGLLATPDQIGELFRRAGFTEVRTVEEEHATEYRTPDDWWAATWAGGRRAMLSERIPAERREEARKAALAELEPLVVAGTLTRRTPVRYTTAVRG